VSADAKNRRAIAATITSTLALACALLVFGAGSALAADPVEIDVSGRASLVAGVSDGDGTGDADAEIRIKGSTVFANGVEIGAVVEGRLDGQQPDRYFAAGRYTGLLIGGPRGVAPLGSDVRSPPGVKQKT